MDILPDGVIRATDHIVEATAGEALVARDAVYIDAAGDAYKCDESDLAKIGFVGFVIADVAISATVRIRVSGHMGGFTGLSVNSSYYVSNTVGGITTTKPTNFKVVGTAISPTVIKIFEGLTERVLIFESSSTWTKPPSLLKARVQVQAAGGNGETTTGTDAGGGGGSGGGYTEKLFYNTDLGATETVTIGATTFATTFGSLLTAQSGLVGATSPVQGGTSSGGSINVDGSIPGPGTITESQGGKGGDSFLGAGGQGGSFDDSGEGGKGYGGGGGGNSQAGSVGGGTGGAGAPGVVIVTEFY